MDDRQLVCYARNGTCSLRGSVCCVLLTFFSLLNILSKSPSHDKNLRCCPLKETNKTATFLYLWQPIGSPVTCFIIKLFVQQLRPIIYIVLNKCFDWQWRGKKRKNWLALTGFQRQHGLTNCARLKQNVFINFKRRQYFNLLIITYLWSLFRFLKLQAKLGKPVIKVTDQTLIVVVVLVGLGVFNMKHAFSHQWITVAVNICLENASPQLKIEVGHLSLYEWKTPLDKRQYK